LPRISKIGQRPATEPHRKDRKSTSSSLLPVGDSQPTPEQKNADDDPVTDEMHVLVGLEHKMFLKRSIRRALEEQLRKVYEKADHWDFIPKLKTAIAEAEKLGLKPTNPHVQSARATLFRLQERKASDKTKEQASKMLDATVANSRSLDHLPTLTCIIRAAQGAGLDNSHDSFVRAKAHEAELMRLRDVQDVVKCAFGLVEDMYATQLNNDARCSVAELANCTRRLAVFRGQLIALHADASRTDVGKILMCTRSAEKMLRNKRQTLHTIRNRCEEIRHYMHTRETAILSDDIRTKIKSIKAAAEKSRLHPQEQPLVQLEKLERCLEAEENLQLESESILQEFSKRRLPGSCAPSPSSVVIFDEQDPSIPCRINASATDGSIIAETLEQQRSRLATFRTKTEATRAQHAITDDSWVSVCCVNKIYRTCMQNHQAKYFKLHHSSRPSEQHTMLHK